MVVVGRMRYKVDDLCLRSILQKIKMLPPSPAYILIIVQSYNGQIINSTVVYYEEPIRVKTKINV